MTNTAVHQTQTTLWKRRKYIRLSFTINYKLVQEPRNNSLCGWAKILAVSKDLGRSTTWILNCKFYLNLPSPNFPNSSQDIPPHSPTISQWHYRQLDEHTAYTKGLEVLVLLYFSQSLSPGTLIVISSLNILHSKPPNDVLGQRLSQENEDKIPLNRKTNSYCSCGKPTTSGKKPEIINWQKSNILILFSVNNTTMWALWEVMI